MGAYCCTVLSIAWYKPCETKQPLKKKKEDNRAKKLARNSSVIAFQIARVIRCSVVDIKANRRPVPIEAYPLRSHEGERIEGE